MSQISRKARTARANPQGRILKPYMLGAPPAKTKLIRLDESQLKLIERAARSLKPQPTSSYFIVEAALERAKAVLAS